MEIANMGAEAVRDFDLFGVGVVFVVCKVD